MAPATIAVLASLFMKGLSAFTGGKAKTKKQAEANRANTAALELKQKMAEDARRGRLQLGNSILNRVPGSTAGGGVATGVGIDPALFDRLNQPRSYDFASAMPKPGTGAVWDFLSGLSGGGADTAARLNFDDESMNPFANQAGRPSALADQAGGDPFAGASSATPQTITLDDLMKLFKTTPNGQAEAGGLT